MMIEPSDSKNDATFPPDPEAGRRDPAKGERGDRRRGGWRDFRRAYPGFVVTLLIGLVAMAGVSGFLFYKRGVYEAEVVRLRANMTDTERARTDAIVAAEENKARIALELARRQAKIEKKLHLSVAVDSGRIYLEREGAILRDIPATFGAETKVGAGAASIPVVIPRGQRTIVKVGDNSITLDGGTVISAADSAQAGAAAAITPGNVRIALADMKAIMPNLSPGMRVYFY
ncbi:MAG: hypothetical protein ABIR58_03940 [Gemmatimonadaceae bacterium]